MKRYSDSRAAERGCGGKAGAGRSRRNRRGRSSLHVTRGQDELLGQLLTLFAVLRINDRGRRGSRLDMQRATIMSVVPACSVACMHIRAAYIHVYTPMQGSLCCRYSMLKARRVNRKFGPVSLLRFPGRASSAILDKKWITSCVDRSRFNCPRFKCLDGLLEA